MDKRSAAMVILSASLLIFAIAWLILGRGANPGSDQDLAARFRVAVVVAGLALAGCSVGFSRVVTRLRADELPRAWQSLGAVIAGVLGLLLCRSIFDWRSHYLPSDARSQPGNVLAAVLFFGFGAALLIVVGTLLLYARARPTSR
jgi:hypothetical protein